MTTQLIAEESKPKGLPSFITARHIQLLLVAFGLFVSGYLTYVKATNTQMACVAGGMFNCGIVQSSSYSMMFGVPIAYFGFAMYIVLGVILLFQYRVGIFQTYGNLMIFGISTFGWLFSMYLVYIQFFVLKALCPWCLAHEANFTLFYAVVCYRMWREMRGIENA
jgi:uncharacterized membrane protein